MSTVRAVALRCRCGLSNFRERATDRRRGDSPFADPATRPNRRSGPSRCAQNDAAERQRVGTTGQHGSAPRCYRVARTGSPTTRASVDARVTEPRVSRQVLSRKPRLAWPLSRFLRGSRCSARNPCLPESVHQTGCQRNPCRDTAGCRRRPYRREGTGSRGP